MGHLLGYARVSTAEQNADLQTDELTAAGCWKVFVDQASGVLDRRPELDRVLEQLRPGDTLGSAKLADVPSFASAVRLFAPSKIAPPATSGIATTIALVEMTAASAFARRPRRPW